MEFNKDVYRELEDIVGPGYISSDLAVLEPYSSFGFGSRGPKREDRYFTRPEAILLPSNTQEVQAIVKLCNRRGLKFKASSTGYGSRNAAGSKGVIILDMRRMNRILDIDEKNMCAIVEPYVSFAQLQGEAMKRGLNTHVIGAGSNCSVVASFTSFHGTSNQAISHSWSGRNVLGVEWVLPTGDILKLGAQGIGAGWFSADGPGPSMRGIMRGAAGALGGLGVFTKCACHLHPWPGPQEIEIKGISPYYEMEVPPNFEYHVMEWPTWEKCADGILKISATGMGYSLQKTGGPGSHGAIVTGCNNEYFDKWSEYKDIPWISYSLVTAAATPDEHDWQVKTLNRILEDTSGKIIPVGEIPDFKKRDIINMIKGCFIPRVSFRTAGSFCCPLQGQESIDHAMFGLSFDKEFRKPYDDKGLLVNDGINHMWSVSFEGGHFALFECGHLYSITDEDSHRAGGQMMMEGNELSIKQPLSIGWTIMGDMAVNKLGPLVGNVQNWQRKIKIALDPNTAADPLGYISPEIKDIDYSKVTPFSAPAAEDK